MQYNGSVMEDHNPNTDLFVPAITAYHRAMATRRIADALQHAETARDNAPCDSEAARWAAVTAELKEKTTPTWQRFLQLLGVRSAQ